MTSRLLAAFLLLALSSAGAQVPAWEREALPLKFAQPSSELRRQFEAAWRLSERDGVERKFCITSWTLGETKDGDTVYVATAAELQPTPKASRLSTGEEHAPCLGERGRPLPSAHTHLNSDCTPSRGDVTNAIKRAAPFDLVICGPGITNGYIWTTYRQNP